MKFTKILVVLNILLIGLITMGLFKYPVDTQDKQILKDVVKEFLPDLIFDVNWDNYFFDRIVFEDISVDLITCDAGAGICPSTNVNPDGLVLNNESLGGFSNITKSPIADSGLSWAKPKKMRAGFRVPFITSQTAYILSGSTDLYDATTPTEPYFGFKIVNGNLFGVCFDDGIVGEVTSLLQTISANTSYVVDARYSPSGKIVFRVDGIEKGVITTGLPDPNNTGNKNYYNFSIDAEPGVDRTLIIAFFEFTQLK